MLALLADNSTGQIEAADLRAIVSELYFLGTQHAQVFSYVWTTTPGPGAGKVTIDLWSMSGSKVQISETTDDGQVLTFALLDGSANKEVRLLTGSGKALRAHISGPSVDQGGFRDLPIQVLELTGAAPSNNERMSVALVLVIT